MFRLRAGNISSIAIKGLILGITVSPMVAEGLLPQLFFGFDNGPATSHHPISDGARDDFLLATRAASRQDFESPDLPGIIPAEGMIVGFPASSITAVVRNLSRSEAGVVSGVSTRGHHISGSRYLSILAEPGPSEFIAIEFSGPVQAIGFYATDVSDYCCTTSQIPPVTVEFESAAGTNVLDLLNGVEPAFASTQNTLFFGYADPDHPFTRVILRNPPGTGNEGIGLDDLYIVAAPVNQAPEALCIDTVVSADSSCTGQASVDAGSFDPDGTIISALQNPSGPYALGHTAVSLRLTDNRGASSTCSAFVSVVDSSSAVPDDLFLPVITGECSASVTSIPTASDNCSPRIVGSTTDPLFYNQQGQHDVIWTYEDAAGNLASQNQEVSVADTTVPSISLLAAHPSRLWPPNHKMRNVAVAVDAVDNCAGSVTCQIVAVASNEPDNGQGDGNTSPDWIITGDLTVSLRAERSGAGQGRVYTITIECTDVVGNTSTRQVLVTVPHNQ